MLAGDSIDFAQLIRGFCRTQRRMGQKPLPPGIDDPRPGSIPAAAQVGLQIGCFQSGVVSANVRDQHLGLLHILKLIIRVW